MYSVGNKGIKRSSVYRLAYKKGVTVKKAFKEIVGPAEKKRRSFRLYEHVEKSTSYDILLKTFPTLPWGGEIVPEESSITTRERIIASETSSNTTCEEIMVTEPFPITNRKRNILRATKKNCNNRRSGGNPNGWNYKINTTPFSEFSQQHQSTVDLSSRQRAFIPTGFVQNSEGNYSIVAESEDSVPMDTNYSTKKTNRYPKDLLRRAAYKKAKY